MCKSLVFLPIGLFKHHTIKSGHWKTEMIFESSGTTKSSTSKHHIRDLSWYHQIAIDLFQERFGLLSDYHFIGLLPSYLERNNSSLVSMTQAFMQANDQEASFHLHDFDKLIIELEAKVALGKKVVLIGVSFALLDLVKVYQNEAADLIIIETGGMKGRRREMVRSELHREIRESFPRAEICSEYGMTELQSQAYSSGKIFKQSTTLAVHCMEINDPFARVKKGKNGVLNVVDMANLDSISFIATEDLGKLYEDGSLKYWAG